MFQASRTFEDALERLADEPSSKLRGVNAAELRDSVREYKSRVHSIVGKQQPKAGPSKFTSPETFATKEPNHRDAKASEPSRDAAHTGSTVPPMEVFQQGERVLAMILGQPAAGGAESLDSGPLIPSEEPVGLHLADIRVRTFSVTPMNIVIMPMIPRNTTMNM